MRRASHRSKIQSRGVHRLPEAQPGCRMIRQCEDGEKHNTLLRAARLLGGYVAAGRMEEEEVVRVLMREIHQA